MILTESIKNSFETVIALDAQIKELTEARDKAKAAIRSELNRVRRRKTFGRHPTMKMATMP